MAGEVNVLAPHWREVATHAVAFTAAVLVLRRFAWKPILGLLDERREKIAGEFDTIEREKRRERDAQGRVRDAAQDDRRAGAREDPGSGRRGPGRSPARSTSTPASRPAS